MGNHPPRICMELWNIKSAYFIQSSVAHSFTFYSLLLQCKLRLHSRFNPSTERWPPRGWTWEEIVVTAKISCSSREKKPQEYVISKSNIDLQSISVVSILTYPSCTSIYFPMAGQCHCSFFSCAATANRIIYFRSDNTQNAPQKFHVELI